MQAPEFWRRDGILARALAPAAWLYGLGAAIARGDGVPRHISVPVICVGNVVAGGAGKTPVALALGAFLAAQGKRAHFLTRGYGGSLAGPVMIDPALHRADDVGDEALLLAAAAPTWVARARAAGALAAEAAGAEIVVMDDGLQNNSLAKDMALLVIDGEYGIGNGRSIPAGPLREPLAAALARCDAVVLLGADETGIATRLSGKKILAARLAPTAEARRFAGQKIVAFAGIGRPEKFFASLEEAGARIVARHAFPDHHPYRAHEIARLIDWANRHDARPVTTRKDWVRLPSALAAAIDVLDIRVEWAERPQSPGAEHVLTEILAPILDKSRP